jgi:DNA-binding MarR family transcriptional regulator
MENMIFYRLGYQLHRANHALAVASEKPLKPLGVTLAQVNVLLFVDRFPGATMARLARLAVVTPQALHRTAIHLEQLGLIRRDRRIGDEKSFYLLLTDKGAQTLRQAEAELKAVQDIAKKHFQTQELEILYEMLQRYEAIFQDNKKEES